MRLFIFLFILLLSISLSAQIPIDTTESEYGKIVLFSDQSWKLVKDPDFNGVLNERVHELMNCEELGKHELTWKTDDCYSRSNDLTKLKDTVWICVESEELGGFTIPFDGVITVSTIDRICSFLTIHPVSRSAWDIGDVGLFYFAINRLGPGFR